jgi:hypothetical protein
MRPVFVEIQILQFEKRSEKTLLSKSATFSSAARCVQPVARLQVGPARRGARAGCPDQIDYADVCHKCVPSDSHPAFHLIPAGTDQSCKLMNTLTRRTGTGVLSAATSSAQRMTPSKQNR